MTDVSALREKTDQELETELQNEREALFKLRFRKVTDVVENPADFKARRRTIARILTILNQRNSEKRSQVDAG